MDEASALGIRVKRQHQGIDVLALISIGEQKYALAIEDKTHTTMHGDQLRRYRDVVNQDFPDHEPLLVYLKTGEVSRAAQAKIAGYAVYSRKDFLKVLGANRDDTEDSILRDFREHLWSMDRRYEAFRRKSISDWINDWHAWQGFFESLQREMQAQEIKPEWGYAANQTGGELVFYWGGRKIVDGNVYLEIHKKWDKDYGGNGRYFLAFKLSEVPEHIDRREVRRNLYRSLMEVASEFGWGDLVNKPRRFGYGQSMVFCETTEPQDAWLVGDKNGKIDMANTIERLDVANELLCAAADRYERQQGL